jgi:hypothetical protein
MENIIDKSYFIQINTGTKPQNIFLELNYWIQKYLKVIENKAISEILTDIKRIIDELNILIEELDYRKISFDYFENKSLEYKLIAINILEKLPDDFYDFCQNMKIRNEKEFPKTIISEEKNNVKDEIIEMSKSDYKKYKFKFIRRIIVALSMILLSIFCIIFLPNYLRNLKQLFFLITYILPFFLVIYFFLNFKILTNNKKRVITGPIRKITRKPDNRKNKYLKYYIGVGDKEFIVTYFDFQKYQQGDIVEMHIAVANNKLLIIQKVNNV